MSGSFSYILCQQDLNLIGLSSDLFEDVTFFSILSSLFKNKRGKRKTDRAISAMIYIPYYRASVRGAC